MPGLEEPLVATGEASAEEDTALDAALEAFHAIPQAEYPDKIRPLLDDIAAYPQSPWNMALFTNLGIGYYREGYFSKSFTALERAWRLGRDANDSVQARALTDPRIGCGRLHVP
jgi:hypothetical protein